MATHGHDLVREARQRARLTQRELADRSGTTQSAIARLESGRTRPASDEVMRLIRLCGMDLRSKQAANRPEDQRVLPTLREILAQRDTGRP